MKKLLSSLLVVLLAASSFSIPAYALGHVNSGDTPVFSGATSDNVFGDLLDWSGVVFGNANNIIDVEGTLAVGGNFSSPRGLSVNGGAYGSQNLTTEDVAFLVNGNVNISGNGSVWGQTVVGNADGNTYHLSNVTPSATTNGQFAVADSSRYFADAKNTAYAVKAAVDALPVNGVCHAAYGTYTFVGDADAKTLVYNVDDANISSYTFDFTIAEGQTVVVNFTTSDTLRFKYGAVRINGKSDQQYLRQFNRNIILNVVSADKIEMTGCELYGTLLAPDAELIGNDANVCGTSILNGLTGNGGFELHVGYNNSFIPTIPVPGNDPDEKPAKTVSLKVITPLGMAVRFEDGSVYYSGDSVDVEVGKDYRFQMCCVDWSTRTVNGEKKIHKPDETFYPAETAYLHTNHGTYSDDGLGLRGTVVYTVRLSDKYGDRSFDEDTKTFVIPKGDYVLRTDVNKCFMAYRFTFRSGDFNKQTGIDNVVYDTGVEHENTLEDFGYYKPLEFLSVNLPLGSTVTAKAYKNYEYFAQASIFVDIDADNPDLCYKTYVWPY